LKNLNLVLYWIVLGFRIDKSGRKEVALRLAIGSEILFYGMVILLYQYPIVLPSDGSNEWQMTGSPFEGHGVIFLYQEIN
jgi:hypothetical protein